MLSRAAAPPRIALILADQTAPADDALAASCHAFALQLVLRAGGNNCGGCANALWSGPGGVCLEREGMRGRAVELRTREAVACPSWVAR